MHRPLSEINTNPRQSGSVPTTATSNASQTPSPVATNITNSGKCRIPVFISQTGSPRHAVHPPPTMSPSGCKIPRKLPGQILLPKRQSVGNGPSPQRSTLPRSRGGKSSTASPLSQPAGSSIGLIENTPSHHSKTPSTSPTRPTNRDKPLPSPPVAHIVDPASPPKARRTLVDAEVAGSPRHEDWPALCPEHFPPINSTVNDNLYDENNALPMPTPLHGTNSLYEANRTLQVSPHAQLNELGSLATSGAELTRLKSISQTFAFSNTMPEVVHTVAAKNGDSQDSPLAYKSSICDALNVPPSVPPRASSLPIPARTVSPSCTPVTPHDTHPVKPGSTKWPFLDNRTQSSSSATFRTSSLSEADNPSNKDVFHRYEPGTIPPSTGPYRLPSSQRASFDSASTNSLEEDEEGGEELERGFDVRVKRLSAHNLSSGLGPVLKIARDADEVLLGEHGQTRDTAPASDSVPIGVPQERSISALAGRISRQTIFRMSMSIGSRPNTPQSLEMDTNPDVPVRINPIRSMQPSRVASAERPLEDPTSLALLPPTESCKASRLPMSSSMRHRNISGSPQSKHILKPKSRSLSSSLYSQKHAQDSPAPSEDFAPPVPPKANQFLGYIKDPSRLVAKKTTTMSNKSISAQLPDMRNGNNECNTMAMLTSTGQDSPYPSTITTSPYISPSPPQMPQSHVGGDFAPVFAPKPTGTYKLNGNTMSREKPSLLSRRSGNSLRRSKSLLISPSLRKKYNKDTQADIIEDGNDMNAKIKNKRSFREMFHRRQDKKTEKKANSHEGKRSSLTATGNALARRLRNSTNFSKVNLSTASDDGPERSATSAVQMSPVREDLNATCSDADSINVSQDILGATRSDMATAISKTVSRVSVLPKESPDRLRGLEIAEGILTAVETYKQAKMAAMQAKKHARDAELHAERAGLLVYKLQQLVDMDFDDEMMCAIKKLIKGVELIGIPKQPSQACSATK